MPKGQNSVIIVSPCSNQYDSHGYVQCGNDYQNQPVPVQQLRGAYAPVSLVALAVANKNLSLSGRTSYSNGS